MIISNYKDLLTKVKERKLRWYGHIIRDDYSMSKILLQGTVNGTRKRGCSRLKWSDNIYEWTGLNVCYANRAVADRKKEEHCERFISAPTAQRYMIGNQVIR